MRNTLSIKRTDGLDRTIGCVSEVETISKDEQSSVIAVKFFVHKDDKSIEEVEEDVVLYSGDAAFFMNEFGHTCGQFFGSKRKLS